MPQVHAVLGGSGGAGAAIVATLARGGHHVRAVSRHRTAVPDGVTPVVADISDPVAAKAAVHGADVVYMAAHPGYTRLGRGVPCADRDRHPRDRIGRSQAGPVGSSWAW